MRSGTIAALLLTASLPAFAADPFVGTWKPANVEKWKLMVTGWTFYTPYSTTKDGSDTPDRRKSELMTLESADKDNYRITWTTPDGKTIDSPLDRLLPGREGLLVDGIEHQLGDGNATKIERIGERHLRMTESSPKGSAVTDWVVSSDDNSLTETRKGTAPSGRPLDELLVYSRK